MRDQSLPATTTAVLERAAWLAPCVEAVVCEDDRMTYAELLDRVHRVRAALRALGVRPGDHVALCLGNGSRWLELFYAITAERAVAVPINTRYRAHELSYCLSQSQARFLFAAPSVLSSDFAAMIGDVCPSVATELPDPGLPKLEVIVFTSAGQIPSGSTSWETFMEAAQAGDHGPGVAAIARPDDIALIQYTSGTTSRPKGVLLRHESICLNALVSGTRMGLRLADRFHSVRPFFHVAGSTLSVLSSAQHLTTLITMTRFEPGEALRVLEREKCTHFSGNDAIALMLLNHPERHSRQLALRGAWVAASTTVVRRVIEELGATEAVVGYGLSEASPNVAQSAWHEDHDLRISTAMLPQPGVHVRIWDPVAGYACAVGSVGEIQVQGWNVMQGYHNQPELTVQAFTKDGWLRTGDLGTLDTTGRLTFVGRAKDVIRVGGENVSPAEIEDLLLRHPAVRQAVIVGVPDERLVEVPFAFVTLNHGHSCDARELIDWTRERISGFKVPRYLRVVDSFEQVGMTASSKVQKNKLATYAEELLKGVS